MEIGGSVDFCAYCGEVVECLLTFISLPSDLLVITDWMSMYQFSRICVEVRGEPNQLTSLKLRYDLLADI